MVTTLGGLWHGAAGRSSSGACCTASTRSSIAWFREFCECRPSLDQALQTLPGAVLCMGATFMCVSFALDLLPAQLFSAAMTSFS